MKPLTPDKKHIVDALLDSYRRGYFPMAEPKPPWNPLGGTHIYWPSPDPRGTLPLSPETGFHVPRRLDRRLGKRPFTIRCDTAFERVVRGCALPRISRNWQSDEGTWIDETIVRWFCMLHEARRAHSIEAWRTAPDTKQPRLVGGVYGLSIGSAFFGESMFCLPRPRQSDGTRHPLDGTDASSVCLVLLARHLNRCGYTLMDTQMVTPHVARFGGVEIPRRQYLIQLSDSIIGPDRWQPMPMIEQAVVE